MYQRIFQDISQTTMESVSLLSSNTNGKIIPKRSSVGGRIPIVRRNLILANDRVPRTLYLERVHDFIGTEGILHVAGIVALVSSLHVPQRQRVVRPDVRPVG